MRRVITLCLNPASRSTGNTRPWLQSARSSRSSTHPMESPCPAGLAFSRALRKGFAKRSRRPTWTPLQKPTEFPEARNYGASVRRDARATAGRTGGTKPASARPAETQKAAPRKVVMAGRIHRSARLQMNLGHPIFLPSPATHRLTLPQGESPNSPTAARINEQRNFV